MKSVFTVALISEFTSVIAHAPYHRPTDNALGVDKPGDDIYGNTDTSDENTREEVAQGNFPDVAGKGAGGSYSAFVQLHDSSGFDDSTEPDAHNTDHDDELTHEWSPHGELYGPYFANVNAPDGPSLGRVVGEEGAKHGSSAVELHNVDVHDAGFYAWDEHSEWHGQHDSSDGGGWGHFSSYLGDFFGFDEGTSFLAVRNVKMQNLSPLGYSPTEGYAGQWHMWRMDVDYFQDAYWKFLKTFAGKGASVPKPDEITAEHLDMLVREHLPMPAAEPITSSDALGGGANILDRTRPFKFNAATNIQFRGFFQLGTYEFIADPGQEEMQFSDYHSLGMGANGQVFKATDTSTDKPVAVKHMFSNAQWKRSVDTLMSADNGIGSFDPSNPRTVAGLVITDDGSVTAGTSGGIPLAGRVVTGAAKDVSDWPGGGGGGDLLDFGGGEQASGCFSITVSYDKKVASDALLKFPFDPSIVTELVVAGDGKITGGTMPDGTPLAGRKVTSAKKGTVWDGKNLLTFCGGEQASGCTFLTVGGMSSVEIKKFMIRSTGQHEFKMMNMFVDVASIIQIKAAYDLSTGDVTKDIRGYVQDVYLVMEYADKASSRKTYQISKSGRK